MNGLRKKGMRAVLLIDALAVIVVVASGSAAYTWLSQSRSGPLTAVATPTGTPSPSLDISSTPAASPSPSPTRNPAAGKWTRTGSLPWAVWASASAVLADGRVMVMGGAAGSNSNSAVSTTAIFNPATGSWTATAHMLHPRAYASAVTLKDGTVLVAGGSFKGLPLDTAERFYPAYGKWVATGRLTMPRTHGTLTLLNDGRAFAVGGGIVGKPTYAATASTEIYDPSTNSWSSTAPMELARARHTATRRLDGTVVVVGGATAFQGAKGMVIYWEETYDPASDSWSRIGSTQRYVHGAALLEDGSILIAGGWSSMKDTDPSVATTEFFNVEGGYPIWTDAGSMQVGRADFGMVTLHDGWVLAVGGVDPKYKVLASAELFNPADSTWRTTGSLSVARMWPVIQVLPDGRVLVAGGSTDTSGSKPTAVCEIYSPAPR